MPVTILQGDVRTRLAELPDESVHCVVTSPPYFGLRDYGVEGQIGLEDTMHEHIALLVDVFREMRRVLRKDGTFWLNYGDAYSGGGKGGNPGDSPHTKQRTNVGSLSVRNVKRNPLKPKDRMLLPARLAIALQDDGWWIRDEVIWHKPNPMPAPFRGRTTAAHEMIYLLAKSAKPYVDQAAFQEPSITGDPRRPYGSEGAWQVDGRDATKRGGGKKRKVKVPGGWDKGDGAHGTIHRNGRTEAEYVDMEVSPFRIKRSVWTVAVAPCKEAHFATFPPKLIEPCILAGCPEGGTVLDPFFGAGTTGLVAQKHGRNCIGIELNPAYIEIAKKRLGLVNDPVLEAMFS